MEPFHYEQVDWTRILSPQTGRGHPRFIGRPFQRGGSILGLLRFAHSLVPAIPDFSQAPLIKEVVDRTREVVKDISEGTEPLAALRKRARQGVKNLTGLGKKREIGPQLPKTKRVIQKKKKAGRQPLFIPVL